jgi:hypothetical protein
MQGTFELKSRSASRPFLAIFVTLMALAIGATDASAGAKAKVKASENPCINVMNLLLPHASILKEGKRGVSKSQASRLKSFFETLSDAQRAELFKQLSDLNFERLALEISNKGKLEQLEQMGDQLASDSELSGMLVDVIQFGNQFPGIFAANDAVTVVSQVLNVITDEEGKIDGIKNADLLTSQSEVPRLISTINNTLVNLIQQMDVEKAGMKFDRNGWKNLWYKIKLFIFPAYSRVRRLLGMGQEYQMQLSRVRSVDRLVIELGLAETATLGLTREELGSLTYQVLNSPDEIHEVVSDLKKIFGQGFDIGKSVEIGKLDLYGANREAKAIDLSALWENFDTTNIGSLDILNKELNAARKRKGQGERTLEEYRKEEVQLRHEAADRRIHYYRELYEGFTEQDSNESYTVERRHTRQVPDGQDKDGHPKTRTEVYYVDDTVVPSFSNILSGSYDTGDREVSGLGEIKNRAAEMVASEKPARVLLNRVDEYVSWNDENYAQALTTGKDRGHIKSEGNDLLKELSGQLLKQTRYLQMTDQEIRHQYNNDNLENFRGRTQWNLNRLVNAIAYVEMTLEADRRGLHELAPSYQLMDFTDWLRGLRNTRNANYTIKGVLTAVLGGAAAYVISPDVQTFVDTYTGISYTDVLSMLHLLHEPR